MITPNRVLTRLGFCQNLAKELRPLKNVSRFLQNWTKGSVVFRSQAVFAYNYYIFWLQEK